MRVDAFFSGARLADLTGDAITKYSAHRQTEGAANGTVNREVKAILTRLPESVGLRVQEERGEWTFAA